VSTRAVPRVVLFDIDGTLVDAAGAGRQALDSAFAALWQVEQASEGVSFAGRTDLEIVREIMVRRLELTVSIPDPELVRDLLAGYLGALPEALAGSKAFRVLPGVRPLVETLARERGLIMGLATGNIAAAARLKLAKARLNTFFRTGGFGADAPRRAGVVAAALARISRIAGHQLERGRVFMVGDTVHDIKAAQANGVVPIGVATGPVSLEALQEAGARLALTDLEQGEDLLELIRGG